MCECGAAMVWVRLSNNHRTQFCSAWIARYVASGEPVFFVVEEPMPSVPPLPRSAQE